MNKTYLIPEGHAQALFTYLTEKPHPYKEVHPLVQMLQGMAVYEPPKETKTDGVIGVTSLKKEAQP